MKFMIQRAMLIIAVIYTGAANAFGETGRSSTTESTAQQFGFDQVEIISQTGSTRGTGYIENNKILTMDGKMHVTWLDAGLGGPEPVRIRTFNLKSGEWSATYTLGEAYDNHGSPTIVNDGDGYLHAVFDGHYGPLCYRRSVRPNDASEWTEPQKIGRRATYASCVCDAHNTLHLVCRDTIGKDRELVYFRQAPKGQWSEGRPLVESSIKNGSYRCYRASLFIDKKQRLQLGFMLFPGDGFDGARSKGALGYMCSDDLGDTWKHFDGTAVNTPTPTSFERIPAIENCYRSSNLVVDAEGMPYITCVSTGREPYPDKWGEATLWKRDANKWRPTPLVPYIQKVLPGHRASRIEPSMSVDEAGRVYVALVTVDEKHTDPRSKWINEPGSIYGNQSSKIVVLVSGDHGATFDHVPLKSFGAIDSSWLPSFERFVGHNSMTVPRLMYTRGAPGIGTRPKDISSDILLYQITGKN